MPAEERFLLFAGCCAKAPRCRALGILRVESSGGGTEGNLPESRAQSDNWTEVMDSAIWFMGTDHGSLRHPTCELSGVVIVSWSGLGGSADRPGVMFLVRRCAWTW